MSTSSKWIEVLKAAAQQDANNTSEHDREVVEQEASHEAQVKVESDIVQLRRAIQDLGHNSSIHRMRKYGLLALFSLVVVWLTGICVFVLLSSFSLQVLVDANVPYFRNAVFTTPILVMSDNVLIALITSTTLNVLGMFAVAAKWLYSTPKQDSAKPKKKKPAKNNLA
jgi:uncharacterized membrane protein